MCAGKSRAEPTKNRLSKQSRGISLPPAGARCSNRQQEPATDCKVEEGEALVTAIADWVQLCDQPGSASFNRHTRTGQHKSHSKLLSHESTNTSDTVQTY